MSDQTGTVFNGRYELQHRLGRGGMADVYLARDLQLDRPVAVKALFPEFATDPNFVARFRREAQAAARLNHPNIVGVYDWGREEASGTYFIVMEYIEGRTLADIIRADGPMPAEDAVDVATDVAAALGFAHQSGVLHRDIKPGNIIVTPAGMAKVADWGIGRAIDAAVEDSLTQTGAVMGTATYFSPEQAQGLQLDQRSDLYSLGVVLYELTTGLPPFGGDSPVAIAYKHVQQQPRPPRSVNVDVPPDLEAIILQLLAKDPNQRYASADELRADLRRFREGFAVQARRPGAAMATGVAAAATQAIPTGYSDGTRIIPADDLPREYREAPPSAGRSWAFVAALVLLLAVLAGLLFLLARSLGVGDDDPEQPTRVAVPNVEGRPQAEAETLLREAGFTFTVEPRDVADPEQIGIVVDQDPSAGIERDEGSSVTIFVGAQNLVPMPDLTCLSVEDAEAELQGLDPPFTGTINQGAEESEECEEGQVVRTEPAAGEDVATTGAITLFVSSGEAPVPVPNVATLTEAQAVDTIQEAGLVPQVRSEASNDVNEGRVIRTEPGAGTEVEQGSTVTIFVSTGPDEVEVPDVVGDPEAAARTQLENLGFEVEVTYDAVPPDDPDAGRVISQSPTDGSTVPSGSTIDLVVGQPADEGDVGD